MNEFFDRSERLLGSEVMYRLTTVRVILFGVGGVGSWCAESLVRTGLRHLTIVDSDLVCESNINRQLMATVETIGQPKVEVMRNRLLSINPEADIIAVNRRYTAESASDFCLDDYDFVIDAIDSLADKAHLILSATRVGKENGRTRLFSSMGAALRTDPLQVRKAEFWHVRGDALARALRNRFKRNEEFPAMKFQCVYSEQPPRPQFSPSNFQFSTFNSQLPPPNGSLSQVTMVFGATLASMVIENV